MQPMNYMIDVGNPIASLQQGYQLGAGIRNDIQKQQEAESQRIEAERQRQQQASVIDELTSNPTADNYAKAMLVMPGAREQLKSSFELRNSAAIQNDVNEAGQLYSAIKNGAVDVAKQMLQTRLAGLENSGAPAREIQAVRAMSQLIDQNPQMVAGQALAVLQTAPGGDKILSAIATGGKEQREQDLQPSLVRKGVAEAGAAESDASVKAVKAKFAESEAVLDLEKKGWDIKKIKEDIDINKQNARIAAMNASLAREGNALKRQELQMKMDDAIAARDEKVRGKVAEATTAINAVNSTAGVFNDILSDEDTLRAAVGTSAWRGSIPGTKTRSMAGKLEQLQNMMTAENLGLLKGAMSDNDIKFLRNISTNLDRYQDEDSFLSEMKRVGTNLEKAQAQIAKKYGAPVESFEQPSTQKPAQAAQTAVNPQTGERLILRNGKWEPM